MFSVQIELTDSFLSQFWRCLCCPLGLASPSSLSLSIPVASSPAPHRHPEQDLRMLLNPSVQVHVQTRAAGAYPMSSSLLVPGGSLPSSEVQLHGLAIYRALGVSASSSRVFMNSPIPYFLIFPPPCPAQDCIVSPSYWCLGARPLVTQYPDPWASGEWMLELRNDDFFPYTSLTVKLFSKPTSLHFLNALFAWWFKIKMA